MKLIHDLRPAVARSLYAVASRTGDAGELILKVVNGDWALEK